MREITCDEVQNVSGGNALGALWTASLPVRAVAGAAMLGWAVGSAIYRTYDDEIQAGLEYVLQ